MFAASHVRGQDANPLFRQLTADTGTSVKWNFYKYLIDRKGKPVGAFGSITTPEELAGRIEPLLAAP